MSEFTRPEHIISIRAQTRAEAEGDQEPPMQSDVERVIQQRDEAREQRDELLEALEKALTWKNRLNRSEELIRQDHTRSVGIKVSVHHERARAEKLIARIRGADRE